MLNVADTVPPTAHAYSKALEFLYFLVNLNGPLFLFAVTVSVLTSWKTVLSVLYGGYCSGQNAGQQFYTTAIEIRDYEKTRNRVSLIC